MNRQEFDRLVDGIETRFAGRPSALRRYTLIWVAIGYAGFLLAVLAMCALGAAALYVAVRLPVFPLVLLTIVGGLLLIAGLVCAWEMLRLRLEPPTAREITRTEAPALFSLIDELRGELDSVPLHRVEVNADYGAGVVEVPRLGLLGWSRHHMFLGLPLLESVTRSEMKSVLAHELAHLSTRDSRHSSGLYCLRRNWESLFDQLQKPPRSTTERWLRKLLARFVGWYWPRFNACAFVLSRASEYRADAQAARLTSAADMASSLWKIQCFSRRLDDDFYSKLSQMARELPEPPDDCMARKRAVLESTPDADCAGRWMSATTATLTGNADTHPSFSDRMRAIGADAAALRSAGFPTVQTPTAAEALLGDALETIRRDVDRAWQQDVRARWRSWHGHADQLKQRLDALEAARAPDAAETNRLWEKAVAVAQLRDAGDAEPLLRQILDIDPAHAQACLMLGRRLLERDLPEGEQFLRRVIDQENEELTPAACEALAAHFRSAGDTVRMQEFIRRLDEHESAVAAVRQERAQVTAADRFLPHDLSDSDAETLRGVLSAQAELGSAWLVRKQLTYFPKQRLYVLCVSTQRSFPSWRATGRDQALAGALIPQIRLPGRLFLFAAHGGFRKLGKKVAAVPESQFYRRD